MYIKTISLRIRIVTYIYCNNTMGNNNCHEYNAKKQTNTLGNNTNHLQVLPNSAAVSNKMNR